MVNKFRHRPCGMGARINVALKAITIRGALPPRAFVSRTLKMQFPALAILLAACLPAAVCSSLPASFKLKRQGASSSFSLDTYAEPLTFTYSTDSPDDTNWIGLWLPGNGPVDGEAGEPSVSWEYTPDEEGTVVLSVIDLEPGTYEALFLAQDGYEQLAEPIEVVFEGLPANLHFPVEEATLHNARQGEAYEAHIGGLVLGRGNSTVSFEKSSGDDWILVSSEGTVTGTPNQNCPSSSTIEVKAIADNGSFATIQITIPVRRRGETLVEDLAVMSYNTWQGGSQVNNYHEKQLRFILESGVDIIGLQEAAAGNHTTRLGQALGWDYWQSNRSVGIISRYPFNEEYGNLAAVDIVANNNTASPGGGVRINLNGASEVVKELNFWSVHLNAYPYGPYHFCFENETEQFTLNNETFAGRTPQTESTLAAIEGQIAESSSVPVVLVGDFNAPSHLDWTDALREKNCGIGGNFPWPTSILPTEAGLLDSFRVAHPDPVLEQCLSWSPIYPFNEGSTGPPEPQDRIDFVYGTKELKVLESECLAEGNPKPVPDHEDNEWTSDHLAVLTHYRLA
jgi:endonuclease/exonuclease/phosphatase family metal-dependent hydrolase